MGGDEDSLTEILVGEVAKLDKGAAFNVVEFGVEGIVPWEVYRDKVGTPQARYWPPIPMSSRHDQSALYDPDLRRRIEAQSPLLFVFSSSREHYAGIFDSLRTDRPDARVISRADPLNAVLRDVITNTPLAQWYELVVVRRTRSGRLVFDSRQLFPPGAERGAKQTLRIWCEPSDEQGTVFAVVAVERRSFRLVSVESASLDPGGHELTAELRRPGRVAFQGLGVKLRPDRRSWQELVEALPARLEQYPPIHLICALEVSGTRDQVLNRIDRTGQVIGHTGDADARASVSVISYGPHSFHGEMPDEPARVLVWGETCQTAQDALTSLSRRSPLRGDYPSAAQLECVLAEVAARLPGEQGRPVLVIAGSRPPFPPYADSRTLIIPCPARNDWREGLARLRQFPGIAFGAIPDQDADRTVWSELGTDAFAQADDLFDARRFLANLGLHGSALRVPFPLVDPEGG